MFADQNGWEKLDLSAADTALSPGDYPGCLKEIEIISRPDVLWFKTVFDLDGFDYEPPALIAAIAAKPGSVYAPRVAEGLRSLHQLAFAARVTLPSNLSPSDLPKLLTGHPVILRCATKRRDGVLELVVRKVLPPGRSTDGK